jgi:hypothetical protein
VRLMWHNAPCTSTNAKVYFGIRHLVALERARGSSECLTA